MSHEHTHTSRSPAEQHADSDQTGDDPYGTVGPHTAVIGIAGSPPWFSCRRCGAYRSTHAGLTDLPCQPDRYEDMEPAEHMSAGDVTGARVDQVLDLESEEFHVLAHMSEHGVRIEFETTAEDIARGDEISIRVHRVEPHLDVSLERVHSRADRVKSPTIVYTGDGGEGR